MAQTTPIEQTGKRLVFEDSIQVQAPIEEVYRRWSDFTHFPDFMSNVEEVRPLGGDRYHWVARIFGIKQEWDAEITERQTPARISWQSINGSFNAGTVSFDTLPDSSTQARLHLEYTPPAGKAGQALDSLTRTTQREVHEDLQNFRRVISGQQFEEFDLEPTQHNTGQRVFGSLAAVAFFGVAGGTIAHYVLEQAAPQSIARRTVKNPSTLLTAPTAYIVGKRLGMTRTPMPFSTGQSVPSRIASYVWGVLAGGSLMAAATLRLMNRRQDALFVGQWVPTFVSLGALSRMIGDSGVQTPRLAQKASWAFSAASLAAIMASIFWHSRGYRKDGLFVGQWAPTLMNAATLARIYREL